MANLTREKLFADFIYSLIQNQKDIIYFGESKEQAKIVLEQLKNHYVFNEKFEKCSLLTQQLKDFDFNLVGDKNKQEELQPRLADYLNVLNNPVPNPNNFDIDEDDFNDGGEGEIDEEDHYINLQPNQSYFNVFISNNIFNVVICPIDYFQRYGYCYDQELSYSTAGRILEDNGFDEASESTFEYGHFDINSKEQIEEKLIDLGFVKNEAFDNFIER